MLTVPYRRQSGRAGRSGCFDHSGRSSRSLLAAASIALIFAASWSGPPASAQDWKLHLPMPSVTTPVQKLNRDGVEAIERQQYDKAEALFYKAYLYDPGDPFTLNNLGYVAELQGELDRALKFYALSGEQGSEATIDRSSAKVLQGHPIHDAFSSLADAPLRTNRMNIEAIQLLGDNRADEAETLLKAALRIEPRNPFTLNNLGVATELTGDYDGALAFYDGAAATRSPELIVVSLHNAERGKPVSEVAAASAAALRARVAKLDDATERAEMLTLRGVSAANRNNWAVARASFLEAYQLDPGSAFALNNRGYVAERDGDLETAQFFYGEAQKAKNADTRIGLATARDAEGKRLAPVAQSSTDEVDHSLEEHRELRRQQNQPLELRRRDGAVVNPPATSPALAPPLGASVVPPAPAAPATPQP